MKIKIISCIGAVLLICVLAVYAVVGPNFIDIDRSEPPKMRLISSEDSIDGTTEDASDASSSVPEDQAAIEEIPYGGSITAGIVGNVDSFDPHRSISDAEKKIFFNIYEGLTKENPDGSIALAAASGYEVSEDEKIWTFTIRDDLKFSDGSPVTLDDVVYSISRYQENLGEYSEVYSIRQVYSENGMIIMKMRDKDSELLEELSNIAIIPMWNQELEQNVIGIGPFTLGSSENEDEITLVRNGFYYGNEPYLDQVTFRIFDAASDEVLAAGNEGLDFMEYVSWDSDLCTDERYEVFTGYMNSLQQILLREDELLSDVNVRRALNMSVDRDALNETLYGGFARVCETAVLPEMSVYYDADTESEYSYDPEAARELLSDAGYPDGITITLTVANNYDKNMEAADLIAEQMAEAGITVEINSVSWTDFLTSIYDEKDYQAALVCIDGDICPSVFFEGYRSDEDSLTGYNNEEYDAAYAQTFDSVFAEGRSESCSRMQEILTREGAGIYLEELPDLVLVRTGIRGYVSYPDDVLDMSLLYDSALILPDEQEAQGQ